MPSSSKNILVTGHTGFVGSHLLPMLRQSHDFTVIGASRINGYDLQNPAVFDSAPEVSQIIHLAGMVGVPECWKNPEEAYRTNVLSTLAVLKLARARGIPVIHLGSYMYGAPNYLPIDEQHPVNTGSPYARSKRMSEILCESFAADYSVAVTLLRPFNLYGPGQRIGLISEIINQLAACGTLRIRDDRPKRDHLHVSDLCSAICKVAETARQGLSTYNLGTGASYSPRDIVGLIESFQNRKIQIECDYSERINEIPDTQCDSRLFQKVFGWSPKVTLEQGLRDLMSAGPAQMQSKE